MGGINPKFTNISPGIPYSSKFWHEFSCKNPEKILKQVNFFVGHPVTWIYSLVWGQSDIRFQSYNKLGWAGAQSRLKQLAWSLVQGKAKSYLFTSWNLNVFKFSFNKHSISLWIIPISTSWDWVVPSSVKADSNWKSCRKKFETEKKKFESNFFLGQL